MEIWVYVHPNTWPQGYPGMAHDLVQNNHNLSWDFSYKHQKVHFLLTGTASYKDNWVYNFPPLSNCTTSRKILPEIKANQKKEEMMNGKKISNLMASIYPKCNSIPYTSQLRGPINPF